MRLKVGANRLLLGCHQLHAIHSALNAFISVVKCMWTWSPGHVTSPMFAIFCTKLQLFAIDTNKWIEKDNFVGKDRAKLQTWLCTMYICMWLQATFLYDHPFCEAGAFFWLFEAPWGKPRVSRNFKVWSPGHGSLKDTAWIMIHRV